MEGQSPILTFHGKNYRNKHKIKKKKVHNLKM